MEVQHQTKKVFIVTASIVLAKDLPQILLQQRYIVDYDGLKIYGVASKDAITSENPIGTLMAGYHPDHGCVYLEPTERTQFASGEIEGRAIKALGRPPHSSLGWVVLIPPNLQKDLPLMAQRVKQTGRSVLPSTPFQFTIGMIEADVQTHEMGLLIHIVLDLYMRLGWRYTSTTITYD